MRYIIIIIIIIIVIIIVIVIMIIIIIIIIIIIMIIIVIIIIIIIIIINTLRPGWNGFRFADHFFNAFSWMKIALIIQICSQGPSTLRPRQNGRHFPDDIFKWIFLNENVWISINIPLKFVPRGPINNIHTNIGSGNGLAPTRRQAIFWTNNG